jgi:endo-1,4-beta-xylanase
VDWDARRRRRIAVADGFPDIGIWQSRHSLKVLDVRDWSAENGAPIQQWDMHSGANQQFRIEPLGGGQFALRSVHSGRVLDVSGWSMENGTPIQQWDWHGGNNQRFWIEDAGNDLFGIRSVHSGKVLDVSGWSADNGAPIIQWDWHGGNNQLWQIVMPPRPPGSRPPGSVIID